MHRAIIIDDEPLGISSLKTLIEKYTENIKVVATATNPEEGIQLIEDYKPDIVFLDISMPTMNGFELLERLSDKNFHLIFTTAHQEYAIRAIKNKAHDYLLKPIDVDELKNCVAAIVKDEETKNTILFSAPKNIELSVKDGIIFVRPEDIIRLEGSGSYTTFYLEKNIKHIVSKNLKTTEKLLTAPYFYRCHPSHIINLNKVVKMISDEGYYAEMHDGSRPEISRKKKESFLARLKII